MSFKVQVHRAAELDVAEAQVWYEGQLAGLGADLHSKISEVFTAAILSNSHHESCAQKAARWMTTTTPN